VLMGPYTLAKLSISEGQEANGAGAHHASLEERVHAYAEILAAEIDALAQSGAHLIQIDEPAILAHPEDWPIFAAAIAQLAESRDRVRKAGRTFDLALYTYFADATPVFEKLASLPVDILGLDFTSSPALLETVVAAGSPKSLALGFIDGRRSRMENSSEVARFVDRLLPKIQGGQVFLGTSCGLEYLPVDVAFAKLASLTTLLNELSGTFKS